MIKCISGDSFDVGIIAESLSRDLDGRALAVGGMGADLLPRSILQQYDLRKDVWALLPPMPTPRYDAITHLLGSKLYVAGTSTYICMFVFIIFGI